MSKVAFVREIDDLGRIVIPREYRDKIFGEHNSEGKKMEIFLDGEWLIYTQIDNEEKWMPLKKIFDYYRIYYDDIPDEWNSLTLKFYNDARGTAYFS